MRRDPTPETIEGGMVRNAEPGLLIDGVVLNAAVTSYTSDSVYVKSFRRFALFVRVKSANTPTTVQFVVEFLERDKGVWHKYAQGPFASLYYEDGDTATEINEMFSGPCAGREMRVRVVGVGTSASNTFTVSATLDLSN